MLLFIRYLLLLACLGASSLAVATTIMAITEFELEVSKGQFITVRSGGNAQSQWLETASGDIIVKRSGIWYFAEINAHRQALSTGVPYVKGNKVIPPELVFIPSISFNAPVNSVNNSTVIAQSIAISTSDGVTQQPILVLRVSFTDQDFEYSSASIQSLIFADQSSSSLSVAQYYRNNSYQKFDIQPASESSGVINDGIIDVSLAYNHPNFGSNYNSSTSLLVSNAFQAANPYINFSAYDTNGDGSLSTRELGIVLIIAGYENAYGGDGASNPRVWAHKSSISQVSLDGVRLSAYAMFGEQHQNHLATIGIISHEMAHLLFSLPDLYDRQGDSNGVGRWGLMGLGSWNSRDGVSGSSPAHLLAWSKVQAGFMHPRDLEGDAIDFSLKSATQFDDALRVWLDPFRHGEHFLLEYRSEDGSDRGLPAAGLLISHADDWVGYGVAGPQNDFVERKLVDIEEADGSDDMDLLENRGDRDDVYNNVQNYFGSSSLPTSMDYQGNSSGVEVEQINIGSEVTGRVSLPYDLLGNNLGYDDGGARASWGGNGSVSMVKYSVPADFGFAHGVDFYSFRNGVVSTSLYSSFANGAVSNALVVSSSVSITPGWNRIQFSSPVDISGFSTVYLEVAASASSLSTFGIDTVGDVSGNSFTKLNGSFQSANFDFNQRLLIANQDTGFNYQIPDKLPLEELEVEVAGGKSSGGGFNLFVMFLALLASVFIRNSKGLTL